VQLVRVPEPRVGSAYEPRPLVQPLRYPDGPHDAEALLVHPGTGAAWIITKSAAGEAGVYAAAGDRLRRVATLHLGLGEAVTGAAARPDGRALVVRTYTDAWEWTVPAGSVDLGGALRAAPARHLAIPLAPQGEGVTYLPDGRSLALTSEAVGRNSWPLDVLPLDPAGPSASASEGSAAPPAAPPTSTSAAPGRVVRNAGPGADRTPVWLGLGAATVAAAAGLAGWRVRRARRR
jgi:hypothetical protein